MWKLVAALAAALALWGGGVEAQDVFVNGYYKQNGTYVQPHYRSAPDSNPYNNYSTQGNVNPYTGQIGTRDPSPTYGTRSNSYPSVNSGYGGTLGGSANCTGLLC